MKNLIFNTHYEALKEWTVYGMLEGDQAFSQAYREAVEYLELPFEEMIPSDFYNDCIATVEKCKSENL